MPKLKFKPVLAALIGVGLAFSAGANALASASWKVRPELAERLWPGQAQALVRRGESAFAKGPADPAWLREAERLGRASLRAQALQGKALQLLGLVANARNDQAAAERLMTLSARLSRRNGFAQLWFVDADARAGRTAAALGHFDIAMNASPALNGKLYPVLANALQDPGIRREFAKYVRREPEWLPSFMGYAVDQGTNPAAIAKAVTGAGGLPRGEAYSTTVAMLLGKLATTGRFEEMLALYRVQAPSNAAGVPTSLGFAPDAIDQSLAPVAWEFMPGDSGQASLIPAAGGNGPALRLEAYDVVRVEVARKVLFLSPGQYRLNHAVTRLSDGAPGSLRLTLACAQNGSATLAEIPLERSGNRSVSVPSGCKAQRATIAIVGATGSEAFEAALTRLAIIPA